MKPKWPSESQGADQVKSFYCDNALELKKAAEKLGWNVPTSIPGRPQTNGLIERLVRLCKAGRLANLSQSGLCLLWWTYAMVHFCCARMFEVVDGESSYNKRHKRGHFTGMRIPLGAIIEFLPIRMERKHPGKQKTRYGIFSGYHMQPGELWSGTYLVAEWWTLKNNPELRPAKVPIHRITA